ncbi:hypothetical protein ACS0TY_022855 [Phlomoides rotata]
MSDTVRGEKHVVEDESNESGSELEPEKDLIDGDAHAFDEFRVADEDNDDHRYPVFNPKTSFNPEFQ